MGALLEMREIRKAYPGVLALSDVRLDLAAGEVHCLVGENGAGKSTLMKILAGAVAKDSGIILIDGKPVELHSPADSQMHGIGMVYQDFKLVPELTVAENILLGNEPLKGKARHGPSQSLGSVFSLIDFKKMHEIARKVLAQLGEEIPTTALISSLSVAQMQIVEIAKALSRNVRILAMDEPSAPLTEKELKNLFAVIARLKTEGVGIIYISHRLEEIFEIGDRLTVLRDGAGRSFFGEQQNKSGVTPRSDRPRHRPADGGPQPLRTRYEYEREGKHHTLKFAGAAQGAICGPQKRI